MEFVDEYEHKETNIFYITENTPTTATEQLFLEQFSKGCKCLQECSVSNTCSCLVSGHDNYNKPNGIINIASYTINPKALTCSTYECNDNCKCAKTCGNRLVQFGPNKHLKIIECRESNKGLGLVATAKINRGNFVCEYAGEVISKQEAIERYKSNKDGKLMNYIMCINESFGGKRYVTYIDPAKFGNIGRYLNHGCEPNCQLIPVRVNNSIPKLCIFASRDIDECCELTFDYGSESSGHSGEMRDLIECLCESKNCRQYLPYCEYIGI